MHDMIRDMGREIVRKESPYKIENRSRLWFYDDVLDTLTKHMGTKAVEGLILKLPTLNKVRLSTKALAKMHKLRLLQLNYVHHIEGNDYPSKELRWLCWHGFPKKFIPNNFHVENLVAIDMQYSKLRQVWKEINVLEKLTFLDLSHSHSLTKSPDFLQLPNLEKLILEDCISLIEIHPSIGHLGRLVLVNMRDCKHLKNLPGSICMLKSLEILILSGCSKIETLPKDLGEMEALIELLTDGTAIRRVPSSIEHLTKLRNLSLCGCKGSPSSSLASVFRSWVSTRKSLDSISILPASLLGLSSLTNLSLKDCNLSDEAIPKDLGSLSSLRDLDLRSNNFHSLPVGINNLSMLRYLWLNNCTGLQSLPELPTSLTHFYASGCISLKRLPNLSKFQHTPCLFLTNCIKLVEIPGLGKSQSFTGMRMEGCNNLSNTLKESLLQTSIVSQMRNDTLVFPGKEIPQWFNHQWTGPSPSFRVPPTLGCKIEGVVLCAIHGSDVEINEVVSEWRDIYTLKTKIRKLSCSLHQVYDNGHNLTSPQDHIWVTYMGVRDSGAVYDGVEVEVSVGKELNVKKFGIHLVNSASNRNAIVVGDDGEVFKDKEGSKDKRGRNDDDGEAGPSHGLSDEDPHPKRPRYQASSSENPTSIDGP